MKRMSILIAAALLLAVVTRITSACPFCIAPMQTWSEMVSEADVVVLAKLISRTEGADGQSSHAMVEVIRIQKGAALVPEAKQLRIDDYIFGQPGDLFLLKGKLQDAGQPAFVDTFATGYEDPVTSDSQSPIKTVSATKLSDRSEAGVASPEAAAQPSMAQEPKQLVWDSVERVSEAAFTYVVSAPDPSLPATERLKYFVRFLEHTDALISADAYGEFANTQYEEIAKLQELYPREKLRAWIANKETSPERLGLYGMLLGLCGTQEDALFLRWQIGQPVNDDLRFGVEGLMGGLLLLERENGLKFLEETRFNTPGVSAMECFALVQALQFVYAYEPDLFSKQRLRSSMHPMISHPEMREIVIRNLARWEDWDVVAQLGGTYEKCKIDDPQTAAAVTGFLLTCQKSDTATEAQKTTAVELLDVIRADNPRLVKTTERQIR